jgi:hypothetical protein
MCRHKPRRCLVIRNPSLRVLLDKEVNLLARQFLAIALLAQDLKNVWRVQCLVLTGLVPGEWLLATVCRSKLAASD